MKYGPIRVETCDSLEGMAARQREWNALALDCVQQQPSLSYAWVSAFAETLIDAPEKLICLFAFDGPDIVGVLPVIRTPRHCVFGHHFLLRTCFDHDTLSGDMVVKTGYEETAARALLGGACSFETRLCHVRMGGVHPQSPTLKWAGRCGERASVVRVYREHSAILRVNGSPDEYMAGLSKKFVRGLRRQSNRLREQKNSRFIFVSDGSNWEEHLRAFMAIEETGWKKVLGGTIAQRPKQREFYRLLTRRMAEAGWLNWNFLYVDGKPVAAQLAIKLRRHLVLQKIAYDAEYARIAPGNMLFLETLSRAFESGAIEAIDTLSAGAWQQNWGMKTEPYYTVKLFRHKPCPFFLRYLPSAAKTALAAHPRIGGLVTSIRRRKAGQKCG